MKKLIPVALVFAAALCAGAGAPAAQKIGTSVSDQAVAYALFSIHNPTAQAISYEVRWRNGAWEMVRIWRGDTWEHWSKLDAKGQIRMQSSSIFAVERKSMHAIRILCKRSEP